MFFPDFVVFAARFVLVFSFLETTHFVFSTLFGVTFYLVFCSSLLYYRGMQNAYFLKR